MTAQTDTVAPPPPHPWLARYPDDIDWHRALPEEPLFALWDRAVARFRDRPATDFLGKKSTYGQLDLWVTRMAAGLQSMGLTKGDRVGLFLPNVPYYPVAFFAVLKAGGVVVNFNPLSAEQEIAKQIADSGVRFMVTLDLAALYPKLASVAFEAGAEKIVVCRMAAALPFPKNLLFPLAKKRDIARIPADERVVWLDRVVANEGRLKPVAIAPEDPAVLQYTGGTTGLPKGAILTHGNLSVNAAQSAAWFHKAEDGAERILCVLPFFHVFAMTVSLNLGILKGAELVLMPRFDLEDLLATVQKKKITMLPAVPTIFTAINNRPDVDGLDLSSIAMCISGGAPLPMEVKSRFETLTGCKLVEGYGLTEAAPVVACNPLWGDSRDGSIGLPLPGTQIKIVDLDDRTTPVCPGERGELCVRGRQVMPGYWQRPDDTEDSLRDGWLHTGDVGYIDGDGYVYLVDRIKDLILCSGYNVYPRVVEDAIYQHPAVAEVIVAGVPDEYRGETVKAFVKLRDGQSLDADGLRAFLADKLSKIEMPRIVEFRDRPLPKTLVGKLSRKDVLQQETAG